MFVHYYTTDKKIVSGLFPVFHPNTDNKLSGSSEQVLYGGACLLKHFSVFHAALSDCHFDDAGRVVINLLEHWCNEKLYLCLRKHVHRQRHTLSWPAAVNTRSTPPVKCESHRVGGARGQTWAHPVPVPSHCFLVFPPLLPILSISPLYITSFIFSTIVCVSVYCSFPLPCLYCGCLSIISYRKGCVSVAFEWVWPR